MISCGCLLMLLPIMIMIGFVMFAIHPVVGVLYVALVVGSAVASFMSNF